MPFFTFTIPYKFTVYNTDGEDLPKGPPPSSGVSVEWKIIIIFLFFHNAIIPQNVMHLYAIYLSSL